MFHCLSDHSTYPPDTLHKTTSRSKGHNSACHDLFVRRIIFHIFCTLRAATALAAVAVAPGNTPVLKVTALAALATALKLHVPLGPPYPERVSDGASDVRSWRSLF